MRCAKRRGETRRGGRAMRGISRRGVRVEHSRARGFFFFSLASGFMSGGGVRVRDRVGGYDRRRPAVG